MKRNARRGLVLLALVFSLPRSGPAGTPAPRDQLPKDEAGIAKLMNVTWPQEILPPGARPEVLRALLERGQVILINDHPPVVPWMSAAGILVDAPPEVVYRVFTDFPGFTQFMPMTEQAVPTPVGENIVDVEFTVNVKLAIVSYAITYGCYHYNRPALYRTDWCMSHGEFEVNSGFYQALPADGGKRSMLFYSVYSLPRSSFLKGLYTREPTLEMMTNVSTAVMVTRALKARAEEIYRKSPGHQALPPRAKARPIQETLLEDPKTLTLLAERGKILVLEDGPTVYATAGTVIAAPVEKAFDRVARFEDAPSYIPGVRQVEARGRGAKGPLYFWAVEMNLAFLTYKYDYTLEYELDRPRQIAWQIPRSAGPAPGFWRFIPLDGGRALIFNGSTADIAAMGFLPRYALKVEPTLEHALIGSQAAIAINSAKDHIEKPAAKQGRPAGRP